MYTYTYSYKNIPNEPIGRIHAADLTSAVEIVSNVKQLSIEDTLNLFVIKQDK